MDIWAILGIFGTVVVVPFVIYQTILAHKSYKREKELKTLKNIDNQLTSTRENEEKLQLLNKSTIGKEEQRKTNHLKMPTIENIYDTLDHQNMEILNVKYKEKYSSSFFLTRKIISDHFNDFLASDRNLMVITGKAGTGKSVFICDLVKNHSVQLNIWIQDCAYLKIEDDTDLNSYIAFSIGLNSNLFDIYTIIKKYHPNNKILLIFDAINEYNNKEDLLIKISELVNKINTPNIKILITCRIPAWNAIRRFLTIPIDKEYHTSGPNSFVNMDIFNEIETEQAYFLYKNYYNLKPEYLELTDQVKQFIAYPLFLKLTAESYEGKEIPHSLVLHEVFAKYIIKCLGDKEFDSQEYKILHRTIKLMYDNAVKELKLSLLISDPEVGQFMLLDTDKTPYLNLVDAGLLSQKKIFEGLIQKIDVVFVTYERVFEFLLADLIINNLNEIEILKQLEIAQVKLFTQLRGAVELAVCFSILNKTTDISIIIRIAKLNRPDSRQFLCDVIQTIFLSGNIQLVEKIIEELSRQDEMEPKILAVQAAYLLRMDEKLLELTLAYEQNLREVAALYIYERWNKARLDGNLNDGYNIINRLVSKINLKNPIQSKNALSTFLSVCINMGVHVVDDPSSLTFLISIARDLIGKIPGLFPNTSRNFLINKVLEQTAQLFIEIFSLYLTRIMKDENIFRDIFKSNKAKRAILDVGSLINLEDLTKYKDKVIKLICWDNPSVYFSSRSVLTCQVYLKPEIHLDFLEDLLQNSKLTLQVRINILHAIIFGSISRLVNNKTADLERLIPVVDWVFDLLIEYNDSLLKSNYNKEINKSDFDLLKTSFHFLLFGIFYIDALFMRIKGSGSSSIFIEKHQYFNKINNPKLIELVLWAIEKVGYQGFSEYSIQTLINPSFINIWKSKNNEEGLKALSNLRSLFQDQFDSILQSDENNELWDNVKSTGSFPDPKEMWEVSYGIWIMIGTAVDTTIMKISGLILLDLVSSSKSEEFIKKIVRTLLMILNDPDIIDIAHIQYGYSHNTNWDLFERMNIDRQKLEVKPAIHEYYKKISDKIVKELGRGILYEE